MRTAKILLILALISGLAGAQPVVFWNFEGGSQGKIMRDLIEKEFTPLTGIEVDVIGVPGGNEHLTKLLLAAISGEAPDLVALYPIHAIELGMRGAMANLASYPGAQEIFARQGPHLTEAVSFRSHTFAIFSEYNWMLTYYRTDIFEEMGVEPPATWDDFIAINTRLRARNMSSFMENTLDRSATTRYLFLAFQRGADLYTQDGMASALDTPGALAAFRLLTSFYTDHKVDLENPIFTTFATGESPMAIFQPWMYSMLEQGAPHIAGRWDIAPLPGTVRPDGTLDRTSTASGLAWGIPEGSRNKDAAWELLKWMSSPETLHKFMKAIYESHEKWRLIFASAGDLDYTFFPKEQLPALRVGFENARMQRPVVGGYVSERYLEFAFNQVVIGGENIEQSLLNAARQANAEMERKRKEYARFIQRIQ